MTKLVIRSKEFGHSRNKVFISLFFLGIPDVD